MPTREATPAMAILSVEARTARAEPSYVRQAAMAGLAFLALAMLLAGVLPLWLDEILQLIDTRQGSPVELLRRMPSAHPGSSPLGYLIQQFSIHATGYSVRMARLPAAVFGAGAVILTVLLAGDLKVRRPWLAGVVLCVLPLFLRYATEGRAYSQAVFFGTAATWLFVRGRERWLYALALVAAVYSQPYSLFVGMAHLGWALISQQRARFAWTGIGAAAVAFLPWYLFASQAWASTLPAGEVRFSASWKLPLMLLRELVGGSYWASGLVLILALVVTVRWRWRLTAWLVVVPVLGAVAADAGFGYFVAARQYVWILPVLAVMVAKAAETRWRMAVVALIAVCAWHDVSWFQRWHEDWDAAARVVAGHARGGGAWQAVPPEQEKLYAYFEPGLSRTPRRGRKVMLAVSRYASREERERETGALLRQGCVYRGERAAGGSTLVDLECR